MVEVILDTVSLSNEDIEKILDAIVCTLIPSIGFRYEGLGDRLSEQSEQGHSKSNMTARQILPAASEVLHLAKIFSGSIFYPGHLSCPTASHLRARRWD
jgi:hypothetical protein